MSNYVVIYMAILIFAAVRSHADTRVASWAGLVAMLVISGVIYVTAQQGGYMVAVFAGILVRLLLVPAFFIGFAWFNGTVVGKLARRNNMWWLLLLPSLALPNLAVWWANDLRERREAEQAAQVAAFQLTNIEGKFGTYDLRLPVSPQIQIDYNCYQHDIKAWRGCWASLGYVSKLQWTSGPDGGALPTVTRLTLMQLHPTCRIPEVRRFCMRQAKQEEWCGKRPDLKSTVWCSGAPVYPIEYIFDEEIVKNSWDADQWARIDATGLATLKTEVPLIIDCQAPAFKPRTCRIRFTIAPKVSVILWMENTTETDIRDKAAAAVTYAQDVWSAMIEDG